MKNKKNGTRKVASICFTTAFFLLVIAGAIYLLNGTEVHYSSDENLGIDSLLCSASKIPGAFFTSKDEVDTKHEIKYTFYENGTVDKASYIYTANFNNEKTAMAAANDFHVKYNVYMGGIDIYQENLTPTFTQIGNKVIINLFISHNYFTADTAKLLFIDEADFWNNKATNVTDLAKLYNAKGFSCTNRKYN